MSDEEPNKGIGWWPILLGLSLLCSMTAVWLSQRNNMLAQQSIQRTIQMQQQQREYERSRRGW